MPGRSKAPLLLVCVLLGVYLLVYVSAPVDADGQALLAVAVTAAQHGRLDMNVIGYTEWLLTPDGRMGNFGTDGALYAKKGPTPSLALIPLVLLARMIPWLPIVATAMLFNALVTTATALALYTLARWLHYDTRTSLILGLIYGAATFAVTYVKTLFGEPLAALLVVLAVMGAYGANHSGGSQTHPYRFVAGMMVGLLIGVNTIYVVFVPIIGAYLFWRRPVRVVEIAKFLVPIVAALGLLALFNWARFGSPLTSGYHFAEGEGFNNPILVGLYGLLVSPYRGLFWYNPILVLSIPGWWLLRRLEARLAWLILVLGMAQLLAFASWWSWHGGIVWGPRFLLPILPLLALALAPIIDLARKRRIWLAVLAGFTTLSIFVQVLGVLYSYLIYDGYLRANFWPELATANAALRSSPVMTDPALSPIAGHLGLLLKGEFLEPVWVANGVDLLHLGMALLLIVVGMLVFMMRRVSFRLAGLVAGVAVIGSLNIVVIRQQNGAAVKSLEDALQPPGTVLAATMAFKTGLMDFDNGSRMVAMNAPTTPDDERARTMWDTARRQGNSLWFLTWFGQADPANWQERDLWQTAYFVTARTVENHRALWFDLTPPIEPDRVGGWRFGSVMLDSYRLAVEENGVRMSVQWSASENVSADYQWFIHLIDAGGTIMAQQDRAPQGGYAPTSGWTAGELVIDRLFFPLSHDADLSGWQVRVGWINPFSGERLPAFDADGAAIADGFILLPLAE